MHAEREREARDVRERLPGPDRERRQHRVDLAWRSAPRARSSSSSVASSTRADDDPLRRERRARARRARASTARPSARATRSRTSASVCCGVRPSGERTLTPGDDLVEQAGDAHHEELVEVRREDRAELDALEQRLGRVGGELEHALVQVEPRELAVEQGLAGSVGEESVCRATGAAIIPKGGVRGVSIGECTAGRASSSSGRLISAAPLCSARCGTTACSPWSQWSSASS